MDAWYEAIDARYIKRPNKNKKLVHEAQPLTLYGGFEFEVSPNPEVVFLNYVVFTKKGIFGVLWPIFIQLCMKFNIKSVVIYDASKKDIWSGLGFNGKHHDSKRVLYLS